MRSAIIKKASQDEQHNQSTKQQTFIMSKTLCPFEKKLQKLKKASNKTETKQNNLCFTRKDMVQKRYVRKTNRWQLETSNTFMITYGSIAGP